MQYIALCCLENYKQDIIAISWLSWVQWGKVWWCNMVCTKMNAWFSNSVHRPKKILFISLAVHRATALSKHLPQYDIGVGRTNISNKSNHYTLSVRLTRTVTWPNIWWICGKYASMHVNLNNMGVFIRYWNLCRFIQHFPYEVSVYHASMR